MNQEDIFVENKEYRDKMVDKTDVLDKVKKLDMLPNSEVMTVQMVADYYEVSKKTIESVIFDHNDEVSEDGLKVMKGRELSSLKKESGLKTRAGSLTIIPKRAVLRIGMLLRDSEVAKAVRSYLLTLYEITPVEYRDKAWEIERELSKRYRFMMTEAIDKYVPYSPHKHYMYSNLTKLCYKIVFGKTFNELCLSKGINKNKDNLRDHLSKEELMAVEKIEKAVSVLIELGYNYQEIKNKLLEKQEIYKIV